MKSIIVTGATSMIGVALINEAILNKIHVYAIIRPNSRKKNLLPLSNYITFIDCDLNNLKNLKINSTSSFDAFYHLGWESTNKEERADANKQVKNIKYTIDAVNFAISKNCKKFIGAGSQAESNIYNHISIDDATINIDNSYGMSKLAACQFSANLLKNSKTEFIWARIFSVYGINDSDSTLINYCIKSLLQNQIPYFTKCEQQWDYLYSQDAGRALLLIGEHGKKNSIYNIGSGSAKPLVYYITKIRDLINPNLELGIGKLEYSKNQIMTLRADIDKLTKDTGFIPKISFEEGISKTILQLKRGISIEKN